MGGREDGKLEREWEGGVGEGGWAGMEGRKEGGERGRGKRDRQRQEREAEARERGRGGDLVACPQALLLSR